MIRKGATPKANLITGVRELSRDDVQALHGARSVNVVKRLRDPHHRLARLVASGLRPSEAAAQAGYSYGSLSVLQKDPAFVELVEHYRSVVTEAFAESQDAFFELATSNMLKAERHLAEYIERKEEDGELLEPRVALAISRDAADRFGYGKKTTNLNVNVDFAARLERAAARSARVIDAAPAALPPPGAVGGPETHRASPAHLPKIARRA